MNQEDLLAHFQNIIFPYERQILGQSFNKQEYLIEELIKLVKKEFLSFTSVKPEARERWHILERIFFSQLLGLIENKNYNELKRKLKEFSYTIVEFIIDLQD